MPFTSIGNPKAKLTKEQILQIKKGINQGIVGKALAMDFKVSVSTISRIKRNQTWKEILNETND